LNRFSQQGEVEASLRGVKRWVRHLDLALRGSYTQGNELPGVSLTGQPVSRGGVLFPADTESTEWRAGVFTGYAWSRRSNLSLEYTAIGTSFGELNDDIVTSTLTTYDSIVHEVEGVWRYQRSTRTTLTLTPAWSSTRVVQSGTGALSTAERRQTGRLAAGAEYDAGATLLVQGEAGVLVIEDDRPRLALNANLRQEWYGTVIRLRAQQESGVGGGVTDTVSVTRSATAYVTRDLARRTQASLLFDVVGYISAPRIETDPTIRVVTFTAGVGLSHELARWLELRLDYFSQTQRTSGIDLGGQRHLISATMTATAPQWRTDW
jgi:hypothetical protein